MTKKTAAIIVVAFILLTVVLPIALAIIKAFSALFLFALVGAISTAILIFMFRSSWDNLK